MNSNYTELISRVISKEVTIRAGADGALELDVERLNFTVHLTGDGVEVRQGQRRRKLSLSDDQLDALVRRIADADPYGVLQVLRGETGGEGSPESPGDDEPCATSTRSGS